MAELTIPDLPESVTFLQMKAAVDALGVQAGLVRSVTVTFDSAPHVTVTHLIRGGVGRYHKVTTDIPLALAPPEPYGEVSD